MVVRFAAMALVLGSLASRPPVLAQNAPPTAHPLGAPIARSGARVLTRGSVEGIIVAHELSDDRVVVLRSDSMPVLLDSALREVRRIGRVTPYGGLPQVWRGPADTTLFASWIGGGFYVVDPSGRVIDRDRTIVPPSNVKLFAGGPRGGWLDPAGRFLILSELPSGTHDSATLVWVDFKRHAQDAGIVVRTGSRRVGDGTSGPVDLNDAWVALPNGGVLVIRTTSCRVDYVAPGGVRTQYPAVPCESRVLTPEETRRRIRSAGSATIAPRQQGALFEPAYAPWTILADPDSRVWIARNPFLRDDPYGDRVYDVFDQSGRIAESVTIPKDRSLVGVGRGVVYLVRLNDGLLERVRVR